MSDSTASPVRVRIAPSPTGYFHVGTARAAIFNWLFARHTGGKFLLRVEDTDRERSQKQYIDVILSGLKWLGLDWDEGVVYQSERLDHYRPFADKLLESGRAYRCFCAPDELQRKRAAAQKAKLDYHYDRKCRELPEAEIAANLKAEKPFTVRLKLPTQGMAAFDDVVLGRIQKDYGDLDDFIILKSDGNPLYNFAVVVDDHEMAISHVVRGNDHVNNTFLQKEIYDALGWELPVFAHVPLILRMDKSKMSKRKGDKSVDQYQHEGYLPEAMFNFLALLGWSPKDDREKMTRDEIIEAFSLEAINKHNAIFNPEKLTWLNSQYLMEMTNHELAEKVAPLLVEAGFTTKYYLETRWQWLMKIIGLLKERCKLLTDFAELSRYFFEDPETYDEKGIKKSFNEASAGYLTQLADRYEKLPDLTEKAAETELRGLAEELGVGAGKIIHPTRLAVSGLTGGPSLFAMLEAIGKEKVAKRLRAAVEYIGKIDS